MPEEAKQNLIDSTLKFLEAEFVSADEFTKGMAFLIGQMKEVVEENDYNIKESKEKITGILQTKIDQINAKISKQGESSTADKKSLTEAIKGIKKDLKDTVKELRADIVDATDISHIDAEIEAIKKELSKPPLIEDGLTIKKKLLSLSKKDQIKLKELGGYDELLELLEKKGVSKHTFLPQSGITTTFFALNGADKGRAKNINFIEGDEFNVVVLGDTANVTIPSGGGRWTPQGVTQATVGGIPAGTDLGTDPILISDTLINMFYPATSPLITLTSIPLPGLFEYGDVTASIELRATTTKKSLPITSVEFYRDGGLIYTVPVPNPNGGLEVYTDGTPIDSLTTFVAKASDGVNPVRTSNTLTFTFVYPFYYGVHAVTPLDESDILGLTKIIKVKSNTATVTSPTVQTYVIAYPLSYGALTSILDKNGFETIADYNVYTVSVSGLDGNPVDYKVYQLDHITTQVAFTNTYIF